MLVLINDKPVAAAAIVRGGRALLPLRATAQSLGASVSYDARTRIVTVRRSAMQLTLQPRIIGARAYVPLRSVAQWFGARVAYDARTHSIRVTDTQTAYGTDAPASAFTTPAPLPPPSPQYGGSLVPVNGFTFYTENARAFYPGDWMDFVLIAPPGGSADLQLCNLGYHYTMYNYRNDGRYEVRVPAPNGYNLPNCLVSAWYTSWSGRTVWVPIPLYVGLYTAPQRPPAPGPHSTATPVPRPRPEVTPTAHPTPTPVRLPPPTPIPVPVHTHIPIIEHTPRPLPPAPKPTP